MRRRIALPARGRVAPLALVISLAVGLSAPRASSPGRASGSPVSFSVSASPNPVTYNGSGTLTFAIRMTTGSRAESVGIEARGPLWPERNVFGSPLRFDLSSARLNGPGTISSYAHGEAGLAAGACLRGGSPDSGGLAVELPARATATLTARAHFTAPRWRGTGYDPQLVAEAPFANSGRSYALIAPRLRVLGRLGVHITLATIPNRLSDSSGPPGISYIKVLPRHTALRITGTTDPPLAGQSIRLSYSGGGTAGQHYLQTLKTDAHGHFRTRPWLPPRGGIYEIFASDQRPPAGLLADQNCDLTVAAK